MNARATKPTVYLVEDDADDQYMFKQILDELNIDIQLEVFDNALAVYDRVTGKLERGAGNIRSLYVKTTMGPSQKVEVIE